MKSISAIAVCFGLLGVFAGVGGTGWWISREVGHRDLHLAGVAVIDLDEVARQLGDDVALVKEIDNGRVSLNEQLKTLQSSLQERYRQKSRELESPSVGVNPDAKKRQLVQLERDLNLQLTEAHRTAESRLTAYRQQLVQRFRKQVTPIAQQVAGLRGLGIVLTKNDAVLLAFDNAHDITEAVVAKIRQQRTMASAPPPSRR